MEEMRNNNNTKYTENKQKIWKSHSSNLFKCKWLNIPIKVI